MAVLPLMRARRLLRLDALALAIGAMAPDFEYFLYGRLRGTFSHTLLGLAVFCVPLVLLASAGWQLVVAPMLGGVLGREVGAGAFWWRSPGAAASAIASAAIGAATHLAWDSLTHWGGWFVTRYPALQTPYPLPGFGMLPLYRILQHASSLIGLVVVAIAAVVAIRRRPRVPVRGRLVFALCVAGGVAFAVVRVALFHRYELTAPDSLAVIAISGSLLGCLVAGVVVKRRS